MCGGGEGEGEGREGGVRQTWLVGGLLDELQVELVTECLLLKALLHGQLHHADAVVRVHLLKPRPVGGGDARVLLDGVEHLEGRLLRLVPLQHREGLLQHALAI